MRIAYVCYWNAFARDGVSAKIAEQLGSWRALGHRVELFCLSRAPATGAEPVLDGALFLFDGAPGRLRATARLRRAAAAWNPDVVYLRYDIFAPSPAPLLRRFPSAVEVNTDDRSEYKLRRPHARLYNARNRRAVLSAAAGLVCVTHELADATAGFGKPTEVIANGIRLDGIPRSPARSSPRPRIVFLVGAASAWQGVDKALELARALPEVELALVGVARDELPGEPPPNVRAHGPMGREEYAAILAYSDVGLGTLALYRKGMHEACPLKVREYLAHGLPVAIGYEDTDFVGRDPWYLLRLPNAEANVRDHIPEIRAFLERVRGRRVARAEIEDVVGAESKERRRLAFLARLAGQSPSTLA